jgi:nucleoid DNA-binding protein
MTKHLSAQKIKPTVLATYTELGLEQQNAEFNVKITIDAGDLGGSLERVILDSLSRGSAVYLEGFGIVFPEIRSRTVVETLNTKLCTRIEGQRAAQFEKCYDLIQLHRDRFGSILEGRQLHNAILKQLAVQGISERDIQRTLRTFIKNLRDDVVCNGYSVALPNVGRFLVLHNRQGATTGDWFAGADIFLQSSYRHTLMSGTPIFSNRPTLNNSWDAVGGKLGKPIKIYDLELDAALQPLAVAPTAISERALKPRIAAFAQQVDDVTRFTFITDGMRLLGGCKSGIGTEFIFSFEQRFGDWTFQTEEIIEMARRPLSLGWLLAAGAEEDSLKVGTCLECSSKIFPKSSGDLTAVICLAPMLAQNLHTTSDRQFRFLQLLGITGDEAQVCERIGFNHLSALLEYRGVHQITKPNRSSMISRTHL